jgi:hypothetical protein
LWLAAIGLDQRTPGLFCRPVRLRRQSESETKWRLSKPQVKSHLAGQYHISLVLVSSICYR